jgi:hypothetical protein
MSSPAEIVCCYAVVVNTVPQSDVVVSWNSRSGVETLQDAIETAAVFVSRKTEKCSPEKNHSYWLSVGSQMLQLLQSIPSFEFVGSVRFTVDNVAYAGGLGVKPVFVQKDVEPLYCAVGNACCCYSICIVSDERSGCPVKYYAPVDKDVALCLSV